MTLRYTFVHKRFLRRCVGPGVFYENFGEKLRQSGSGLSWPDMIVGL
jgi:hypothetical protein